MIWKRYSPDHKQYVPIYGMLLVVKTIVVRKSCVRMDVPVRVRSQVPKSLYLVLLIGTYLDGK